jgi:hypothetical protein
MQLCHAGPVQVFCTAAQARWQRLHRQQAAWQWAGTFCLNYFGLYDNCSCFEQDVDVVVVWI